MDVPVSAESASKGPPAHLDSTRANAPASDPVAPVFTAPVAQTPPAPVAASDAETLHDPSTPSEAADLVEEVVDDASLEPETSETAADRSAPEDAPYDPMVHTETFDMLEEVLEISRDCVLLADLTGVIQANGEDLVNEAIPEALCLTPGSPAQSRTPPVAAKNQPAVARTSSIPPLRPHKRQASSSDPSRAKHSRPSTSSSTRIPSVPKAGMSSVNNSLAETARQSR
ncbi:hypothetical protein V6N13_110341 [Hibiscus sabdariffa]